MQRKLYVGMGIGVFVPLDRYGLDPCRSATKKVRLKKSAANWLVSNTAWTFEQIARFCELHCYEVKQIADLGFIEELNILKLKVLTAEQIEYYNVNQTEIPDYEILREKVIEK